MANSPRILVQPDWPHSYIRKKLWILQEFGGAKKKKVSYMVANNPFQKLMSDRISPAFRGYALKTIAMKKQNHSFSKPSKATASNSVTLIHTQRSHLTIWSSSTKPGTNQKKPKSGKQSWNKLKILKSDKTHSKSFLSKAWKKPPRHGDSLIPKCLHANLFFQIES